MVVETSAIVALLMGEPEARALAAKLAGARMRYVSALTILDASARLSVRLDVDPAVAEAQVQKLLDEVGIAVIPISAGIGRKAVAAYAAYGRDHPAALTLTECLAYACAQAYRLPLLFKDGGFAETDVRIA